MSSFLGQQIAKTKLCLVKNNYTKMYLKYIYCMLSVLQIQFTYIQYVLNKNTLQLYF